ncbi:hypothetical protein DV735_g1717, partial [Chaetothyriales sp. CBS 134920]
MSVHESALEEFRQQWQNEVSARKKQEGKRPAPVSTRRPSEGKLERAINHPPTRHQVADLKDESDHDPVEDSSVDRRSPELVTRLDRLQVKEEASAHADADADADEFVSRTKANPVTALEHFEKAVEKERTGNLGDSVAHYRKAYRLDDTVDQQYRKKHFPAKAVANSNNTNPSNAPVTVPNTAHHSSGVASELLTFSQLIESFAGCQIEGIPPVIAGDIAPPCTISRLPHELLVEILSRIGRYDPAMLARLGLVCKRLAYQIYVDNSIWKAIALGPEFGLASQQYSFDKDLQGRQLVSEDLNETPIPKIPPPAFTTSALYRDIFHTCPRVRFTGVYISTVNYTRPGGPSAMQVTWSNPVHIVTYYRYLRFFRDGTCISLLSTSEPIDVVHHLTPENLNLVRSKGAHHLVNSTSSAVAASSSKDSAPPFLSPAAQSIMKHALRGRWRLGSSSTTPPSSPLTSSHPLSSPLPPDTHLFDVGDLHIETEGAHMNYRYAMHLTMKSASRSRTATKNNKLVWKGFWYYHLLTDDWSEFSLRHDKPFFFSRVKSYGLGY